MYPARAVPPSHQIRISPEKSEFDAKGMVVWWLADGESLWGGGIWGWGRVGRFLGAFWCEILGKVVQTAEVQSACPMGMIKFVYLCGE